MNDAPKPISAEQRRQWRLIYDYLKIVNANRVKESHKRRRWYEEEAEHHDDQQDAC